MVAQFREGVWECPELPFTVNDLSAVVTIEDRVITIKHARGSNGNTTLSAGGVIMLDGNKKGSMDLHVNLDDLELDDERLRKKTPAEYMELWDLFKPKGRMNLACARVPARAGGTGRLDCQGPLSRRRGGLSAFSLSARPPDLAI